MDRLAKLSATVNENLGGTARTGRYARSPDFSRVRVKGTRPSSGRGVTFHFKHTYASKTNAVSEGVRNETSAPAHQQYIERRGAAETDAQGEISFGNIGETKNQRTEFWRNLENAERKNARIQSRIIAELPHEIRPEERRRIAESFCNVFADKGMPHWCVVHAPDRKNDARNYHMHVVYSDRPANRDAEGKWDFEHVHEGRYANGAKRFTRPKMQYKDPQAQSRSWIRELRERYASVANEVLEEAECEKRYDPRSYERSGVTKRPTEHLGTRAAHAESKGVDTHAGDRNTRKEIDHRMRAAGDLFAREAEQAEAIIERLRNVPAATAEGRSAKDRALELAREYRALARDGGVTVRRREAHALASEMIGDRLAARRRFLETEERRLTDKPPRNDAVRAVNDSEPLFRELQMVRDAEADVTPFIQKCGRVVRAQDRRISGILSERDKTLSALRETENELSAIVLNTDRGESPERGETRNEKPLIDDLVEDDAFTRAREAAPVDGSTTNGSGAFTDEVERDTESVMDEMINRTRGPSSKTNDRPRREGTFPPEPGTQTSVRIPEIPDEHEVGQNHESHRSRVAGIMDHAFPDAVRLDPDADDETVGRARAALEDLTNAEIRYVTQATRDAADLEEDVRRHRGFVAGASLLREHACDRGLDLETGQHHPERARDRDLARIHTDSALQPEPPRRTRQRTGP